MSTQGKGTVLVHSQWSSGALVFYEKAYGMTTTGNIFKISNSAVKVGDTANDIDFQYYGTGSLSAIIDCGAATFTVTGIATTFVGAVTVGDGSTDVDFKAFFGSANNYLLVDEGNEKVTIAKTWGTAAQTGRPLDVTSTVNAALGSYSNAIKGYVTYGASGRTTGLGSAVNAEISLSAGTSSGTYAPLESELVLGSSASTGTQTGFMYCNATGNDASTFDTNGYFLIVGTGITPATGKFASANSQTLRCSIDGSDRYMVFSQTENGLGLGTSGSAQSYTAGTPACAWYFTAAGSGSTSLEPFYVKSTVTGTSPVGGRSRFHTYANVAAGGWLNALKGYMEFGASGSATGLASGICGELVLSAGTSSGTYAALEAELVAESGASAGTATSFIYMNCSDAATVINSANGYLFELGSGVTDTAGGIFEAETNTDSMSMTHVLKIRIAGTAYYIPLNTSKGF